MKELSAVLSTCKVDLPPDDLKQLYAAFDTDCRYVIITSANFA
jgi:hypothetical protein